MQKLWVGIVLSILICVYLAFLVGCTTTQTDWSGIAKTVGRSSP
jgi:hypothetical protein